jgi:ribosome-associated protein
MPTSAEGASRGVPHDVEPAQDSVGATTLLEIVQSSLEDSKAEAVVTIDLAGKTLIGDYMVVASGRSERHVGAIADNLVKHLKEAGIPEVSVEGMPKCDWVLIDAGQVIVHLFQPEVREFYNLEKMWLADRPDSPHSA